MDYLWIYLCYFFDDLCCMRLEHHCFLRNGTDAHLSHLGGLSELCLPDLTYFLIGGLWYEIGLGSGGHLAFIRVFFWVTNYNLN